MGCGLSDDEPAGKIRLHHYNELEKDQKHLYLWAPTEELSSGSENENLENRIQEHQKSGWVYWPPSCLTMNPNEVHYGLENGEYWYVVTKSDETDIDVEFLNDDYNGYD